MLFFSGGAHAQTLSVLMFSSSQEEAIRYGDRDTVLRLAPSDQRALEQPMQVALRNLDLGGVQLSLAFDRNHGRSEGMFSRQVSFSFLNMENTLWADTDIRALHRYQSLSAVVHANTPWRTALCAITPQAGGMYLDVDVSLNDSMYGVKRSFKQWVAMPLIGLTCHRPLGSKWQLFSDAQLGYLKMNNQYIHHVDLTVALKLHQGPWAYVIGKRLHRLNYEGSRDSANLSITSHRSPAFVGLEYTFD